MWIKAENLSTQTLGEIKANAEHAADVLPVDLDPALREKMARILAKAQHVAGREMAKR